MTRPEDTVRASIEAAEADSDGNAPSVCFSEDAPVIASLEGRAIKPAEELLGGFLVALGDFDTETLLAIADYRDAIHPNGWMQRCIREYVDVWR